MRNRSVKIASKMSSIVSGIARWLSEELSEGEGGHGDRVHPGLRSGEDGQVGRVRVLRQVRGQRAERGHGRDDDLAVELPRHAGDDQLVDAVLRHDALLPATL